MSSMPRTEYNFLRTGMQKTQREREIEREREGEREREKASSRKDETYQPLLNASVPQCGAFG